PVYFTSVTGGEDELHRAKVHIRTHGFEPQVIFELKKLADQRANLLKQEGVVERAKGVDIGLAVRMFEDAHADTFDRCLLYTSDADFLPLIRAVRRLGKTVIVVGFREWLSQRSALEYEPDFFI